MNERVGKYEILDKIGEGGMAAVYRARDTTLEREVALKAIHQFLQEGERPRRRFLNEAKVAAALTHPNIVTIYELGEDGGLPFIAMEYLPGQDLDACIRDKLLLDVAQKIEVARQIALGIEHAHSREVIHRDIKPSNIKLLPSGTVKLLDFGIAKIASENLTKTGHAVGTPSYMAPEQIIGLPVTRASDVFSYGVVLYELFTGRPPFQGKNLQLLIAEIVNGQPAPFGAALGVPSEVEALVMRCLEKNVEQRFENFTAILKELRRIQGTSSTEVTVPVSVSQSQPMPAVEPTPRPQVLNPLFDFSQSGEMGTSALGQDRGREPTPASRPATAPASAVVRPPAAEPAAPRPAEPPASGTVMGQQRSSPILLIGLILLGIIAAFVLSTLIF